MYILPGLSSTPVPLCRLPSSRVVMRICGIRWPAVPKFGVVLQLLENPIRNPCLASPEWNPPRRINTNSYDHSPQCPDFLLILTPNSEISNLSIALGSPPQHDGNYSRGWACFPVNCARAFMLAIIEGFSPPMCEILALHPEAVWWPTAPRLHSHFSCNLVKSTPCHSYVTAPASIPCILQVLHSFSGGVDSRLRQQQLSFFNSTPAAGTPMFSFLIFHSSCMSPPPPRDATLLLSCPCFPRWDWERNRATEPNCIPDPESRSLIWIGEATLLEWTPC